MVNDSRQHVANQNPPHLKSGMSQGKWIGLILGVLVIAVLIYFTFQPFKAAPVAEDVVQAQLRAIREGDIKTAYSFCSWKLQQRNSIDQFTRFLDRNPMLKQATHFNVRTSRTEGGVITLDGILTSREGAELPVRYRIVSENGIWKINYINPGPEVFE